MRGRKEDPLQRLVKGEKNMLAVSEKGEKKKDLLLMREKGRGPLTHA